MKHFILIVICMVPLLADHYFDHDERHLSKELSHLSLTAVQNSEMKEILTYFRKDLKNYRVFKYKIDKQKKVLFLEEDFNVKAWAELNEILAKKRGRIETSFFEKVHRLLSKRQREKFLKHFDDWEVE